MNLSLSWITEVIAEASTSGIGDDLLFYEY